MQWPQMLNSRSVNVMWLGAAAVSLQEQVDTRHLTAAPLWRSPVAGGWQEVVLHWAAVGMLLCKAALAVKEHDVSVRYSTQLHVTLPPVQSRQGCFTRALPSAHTAFFCCLCTSVVCRSSVQA